MNNTLAEFKYSLKIETLVISLVEEESQNLNLPSVFMLPYKCAVSE